jgi:hypothetical protein
MNTTTIRASVATAAIAAAVLTPAAAQAGPAETVRSGNCGGAAEWKMQIGRQHGNIEMEFEVDAFRGQRWRVAVFHDGRRVMKTQRRTGPRSGSFTIRDIEPNRAGVDQFRARAVRLGSRQACVGKASF